MPWNTVGGNGSPEEPRVPITEAVERSIKSRDVTDGVCYVNTRGSGTPDFIGEK